MSGTVQNTARRRRLDPEARHAQLLHFAISAFAENGIERAVHADVAKRAGVAVPTVFKYFPTREALSDAVLGHVETRIMELLALVPKTDTINPGQSIHILAKGLDAISQADPDFVKVCLGWSVAFSATRDRYLAMQQRILDEVQLRISGNTDDRSEARILYGSALLYLQMQFDGSLDDVKQRFVNRMADMRDATR